MNSVDRVLSSVEAALRTVAGRAHSARPCPAPAAAGAPSEVLDAATRRTSGALMRVNHVGEVCAQALYQAQALTARSDAMRLQMERAAREETDHLAWTEQRLRELGDRVSVLNPLWYAGAFGIGLIAGRVGGDAASLGFVVETERQVEQHLAGHMARLPAADHRSRAIVLQMQDDERRHADDALAAGAQPLPRPVRALMRLAAKVMTTTAYRL